MLVDLCFQSAHPQEQVSALTSELAQAVAVMQQREHCCLCLSHPLAGEVAQAHLAKASGWRQCAAWHVGGFDSAMQSLSWSECTSLQPLPPRASMSYGQLCYASSAASCTARERFDRGAHSSWMPASTCALAWPRNGRPARMAADWTHCGQTVCGQTTSLVGARSGA